MQKTPIAFLRAFNRSSSQKRDTDLAGGNLAVLFEPIPGRPIAAVVLGSSREEREQDLKMLAESATDEMRRQIICERAVEP